MHEGRGEWSECASHTSVKLSKNRFIRQDNPREEVTVTIRSQILVLKNDNQSSINCLRQFIIFLKVKKYFMYRDVLCV